TIRVLLESVSSGELLLIKKLASNHITVINSYLTNGSKSIPKLIIRNALGEDLAVWGPRPEKTRLFIEELKVKELSIDELKIELQTWYNNDKGHEILKELVGLISVPV
ncbi:MAG: thioredoxin family protein, partial [Fluviicola sp.]